MTFSLLWSLRALSGMHLLSFNSPRVNSPDTAEVGLGLRALAEVTDTAAAADAKDNWDHARSRSVGDMMPLAGLELSTCTALLAWAFAIGHTIRRAQARAIDGAAPEQLVDAREPPHVAGWPIHSLGARWRDTHCVFLPYDGTQSCVVMLASSGAPTELSCLGHELNAMHAG